MPYCGLLLPLQPECVFIMNNVALHSGIAMMACRLWAIVLLLLCHLVLGVDGKAYDDTRSEARNGICVTHSGQKAEEYVAKHDLLHLYMMRQQMPMAGAVITAKHGERVVGSRPSRFIPTYGGKPSRTTGRWAVANSFHQSNIRPLQHANGCGMQVRAASPRYYYVIALRRLLC